MKPLQIEETTEELKSKFLLINRFFPRLHIRLRNPHFGWSLGFGYVPVTNAYISININWLYTF
jgi:hypothetical protein